MASVNDVLDKLQSKAKPEQLEGMAKYGMTIEKRLGVSVPDMRKLAKELGRDHKLALDLWRTGIAEARIWPGWSVTPISSLRSRWRSGLKTLIRGMSATRCA